MSGIPFTHQKTRLPSKSSMVRQPLSILKICASEKCALGFTASLNTQLRAIENGICLDARCPLHAKPEYVHDPNPLEWSDVPEKMGVRFCACRRTD